MHPLKRCVEILTSTVPVNASLFQKMVFSGVIMVRLGYTGLEWALNPMTDALLRRGRFRDTDTFRRKAAV